MRNVHTRFDPVGRRSVHGGMFPTYKRAAKRRAKRQEWVGFLREQRALALADAYSAEVEAREAEEARVIAHWGEVDAQWERAELERQAARALESRREQWVRRFGVGTLVWEADGRHDNHTLSTVCLAIECDEDGYDHTWAYLLPLAVVHINRDAWVWQILLNDSLSHSDPGYRVAVEAPFTDASLEQMQAAAYTLVRLMDLGAHRT